MDKLILPKSVLETILDWSQQKSTWLRDALRRVVAGGRPDDAAITEIVALCKKSHGATGIEIEPVPLALEHLPPPVRALPVEYRLNFVANIAGVNQLAGDQVLQFEPDGLTVIYGQNGSGKSGYARILKRACRARHAGEIMPDAFNPVAARKATASISISKAGVPQDPFAWTDTGQPDPALSAICVFDRDCASVHLREKNEVAFRPFGLDIPDDLAGVCQRVKERLTAEQRELEAQRHPLFGKPSWNWRPSVGRTMAGLTALTDLAVLEGMGAITGVERARGVWPGRPAEGSSRRGGATAPVRGWHQADRGDNRSSYREFLGQPAGCAQGTRR